MKIMVIGGGAREHAIVNALMRSKTPPYIYSVMKNRNPGIAQNSKEILISNEDDVDSICDFAIKCGIQLAFVGPEAPLGQGVIDALQDLGILCASPTKYAARIETSKTFMRKLLDKYQIAGNLGHASFDNAEDAIEYVKNAPYQLAIKPVGLTGGKGVKVQGDQLKNLDETIEYINEIFENNIGGGKVIIEEKAEGEEFTQMIFTNGTEIFPMPLVQDHKRAYEGDLGPNTGGMGSYSDTNGLLPFVTQEEREVALGILQDIVDALRKEGCPYRGPMYGQFMLTADGPKIIEINARFGDPEAMNVLTTLITDMVKILHWVQGKGRIKTVSFMHQATVCKYVVPKGYGVKSESGHEITVDVQAIEQCNCRVYFGSIDEVDGKLYTGTSRSVGIVGCGDTLEEAQRNCEEGLKHVKCDAIEVRHDIGTAALIQKRVEHMNSIRK